MDLQSLNLELYKKCSIEKDKRMKIFGGNCVEVATPIVTGKRDGTTANDGHNRDQFCYDLR